MAVSVGDKVLLPEYGGQAITLDGDEFHLFREDDILVSTLSCRALCQLMIVRPSDGAVQSDVLAH